MNWVVVFGIGFLLTVVWGGWLQWRLWDVLEERDRLLAFGTKMQEDHHFMMRKLDQLSKYDPSLSGGTVPGTASWWKY